MLLLCDSYRSTCSVPGYLPKYLPMCATHLDSYKLYARQQEEEKTCQLEKDARLTFLADQFALEVSHSPEQFPKLCAKPRREEQGELDSDFLT